MSWDQHRWHASLDHPLAPIVHVQSAQGALCPCNRYDTSDAATALYTPLVHTVALCDHAAVCDDHPFDFERGAHARWFNGAYYDTVALIAQQRRWFAWRVGQRQRIENRYALLRDRMGNSPEQAYLGAVPQPVDPAIEEQVPPERLEAEYQQRRITAITTGKRPWEHEVRPDAPDVEPTMPPKLTTPGTPEIEARVRVHGWQVREDAALGALRELGKLHVPELADEDIVVVADGRGDRTLHVDYRGALNGQQRDRVQSALRIQYGPTAAVVEG